MAGNAADCRCERKGFFQTQWSVHFEAVHRINKDKFWKVNSNFGVL